MNSRAESDSFMRIGKGQLSNLETLVLERLSKADLLSLRTCNRRMREIASREILKRDGVTVNPRVPIVDQFREAFTCQRLASGTNVEILEFADRHQAQLRGHCHLASVGRPAQLVTSSMDGTIKLWDLRLRRCIRTIQVHDNMRAASLAAYLDDRSGQVHLISTTFDPRVEDENPVRRGCVWNLETGGLLRSWDRGGGYIPGVAFAQVQGQPAIIEAIDDEHMEHRFVLRDPETLALRPVELPDMEVLEDFRVHRVGEETFLIAYDLRIRRLVSINLTTLQRRVLQYPCEWGIRWAVARFGEAPQVVARELGKWIRIGLEPHGEVVESSALRPLNQGRNPVVMGVPEERFVVDPCESQIQVWDGDLATKKSIVGVRVRHRGLDNYETVKVPDGLLILRQDGSLALMRTQWLRDTGYRARVLFLAKLLGAIGLGALVWAGTAKANKLLGQRDTVGALPVSIVRVGVALASLGALAGLAIGTTVWLERKPWLVQLEV